MHNAENTCSDGGRLQAGSDDGAVLVDGGADEGVTEAESDAVGDDAAGGVGAVGVVDDGEVYGGEGGLAGCECGGGEGGGEEGCDGGEGLHFGGWLGGFGIEVEG